MRLDVGLGEPVDVHQLEDGLRLRNVETKRIDGGFEALVQLGSPYEASLLTS